MSDEAIVPPHIQKRLAILRRTCPVCQARPMESCTIASNTGRTEVKWFHLDREFQEDGEEV